MVGYVPRVRVDIILDDAHVDEVLKSVRVLSKDGNELGVYWISDVQKSGWL